MTEVADLMDGLKSQWLSLSITVALASLSGYWWRRKSSSVLSDGEARKKIQELEVSLVGALQNCAAERQGRIRAQKALREALSKSKSDKDESTSYPMAPIAVVHSCFSTRNGTPRQPLLVPLAKASLTFDPARVPQAALEGLEGYSHCWIIYVFHLNTDLEKLWKHPSQSKFKAKVESVNGSTVLLSGVDLVDGTPVLDIKPYLPYCDNIQGATVPDWVKADNVLAISSVNFSEGFSSSLADCWSLVKKKSLYSSPDEFQTLIKQVLSWDIRSVSQRTRPHQHSLQKEADKSTDVGNTNNFSSKVDSLHDDEAYYNGGNLLSSESSNVLYRLTLDGLNISYRIDSNANVLVEDVAMAPLTLSS